jgi:nucleotide-binding universal stress UspA family protein
MTVLKNILCPVDLSPYSRGALSYALSIARWYDGHVTALHVAPGPLPPLSGLAELVSGTFEPQSDSADIARRFVQPASEAVGVPVAVVVREGDPADEILAYEQEATPDLIAIGIHGLSAAEKYLLGSVADDVLRRAGAPILAVHEAQGPDVPGGAAPFQSILAAVDFSDASLRALEQAYGLAQEAGARLVILHVVEEDRSEEECDEAERVARKRLHQVLPEEAMLWCDPQLVVTHGPVDKAIGRIAEEWGVGLVVLGAEGQRAGGFGAHVEGVLNQAQCPVLVVPAGRPSRLERPEQVLALARV